MVNSTLYDSEDENQINVSKSFQSAPEKFAQKIQRLGERTDYPVTAILTELGNRILLDAQIDDIYQKYKDPLQFQIDKFQNKVNRLEVEKERSRNTINYLKQSSLDANSNLQIDKDQLITDYTQEVFALEKKKSAYINELSKLQFLQVQRDSLVAGDPNSNVLPLKGAFQFIPKKLSETFCDNCREKLPKTFGNLDNIEIQEYFLDLRNYLQDPNQNQQKDEYDEVCSKIFGKQPKVIGTQSIKQYSPIFLEAVTSKLGKYNENDLNEYIRLNQIDSKNADKVAKELNNHIKKNLGVIYELTEKTAHYSLDPKYLKAIAGIDNILAQTRIYYKIHRDINKNTLVLGGDGQRNYPPGLNTTAKIFSTGANTLFLGELGSYKDITEDNLHTLKNHGMKNIYSAEKSAEFRSLMQIEALRSTASILANSMFFYLSRSGDKFINTIGIKYERNKINKLMPMAMKGAVGGVTYIENEISKSLSSRIIYDYRHVDNREKISAELLEIKNHQIMFDFICAKSEIVDRHNGKVLDISLLRKQNWTIHTDLEANIITVKKDKYEFKLQSINNEYQIIKIKTFPAKIIQELLEKEYGMQLPEYIKNSKFEVEVDLIASRELRNLNIKILELESSKQLGKITFEDQEITDIRKEYNTLNLYLYEVTSTDKNKKNTNASNYPIFKEKLNNLAIKLAPANTVQNLVKEVDSIRKRVARKSIKNSNSNLLLDKIDSFKKQLLNINSNTNLKVSIAEWETLKQEEKENIRSTGSKRRLPDNPSGQNPNKKSKTSNNTDKHLKRNEKEDLSKSNNEKNYNLSKAIKNINLDNPVLLTSIKNINRESIIESNIVMKAFDAVPNINSKALETHVKLDILLEDNHLTNHRDNISTIVKKIDSGEIDSDCIILLERKQYGNNLGIQDVIKLANILKYNEKNPNQNIKLPKEINNDSLIYQDAIMYKAASEKNIKVIGLEGKDLEAQKNSPNYNENREHYMANVIYQLNRRGYSVIAMTGSTHKDNVRAELEKLQSQNKGITRLSKISRNIQSAPTPSNNKATIYANKLGQALERHISKKHLTPPTEKNISNTKKYKTSLLSK